MTLELAGFALLVAFAAAVQGFLGFGYGVIVMGTLTLSSDLVYAGGFVNVTALALSGAMVLREWPLVLRPVLLRVLPAMFVGMALGLQALRRIDQEVMVPILGGLIVAIAAWNLASPSLRKHESPRLDVLFGAVAGLFSGAFNTGGPPLVIHLYRRTDPPLALVVTLQAIFIGAGLGRLAMAVPQGLIPARAAIDALLLLPVVVAGTLGGMALARRAPPERFRRVAWACLGLLGAALVVSR